MMDESMDRRNKEGQENERYILYKEWLITLTAKIDELDQIEWYKSIKIKSRQ